MTRKEKILLILVLLLLFLWFSSSTRTRLLYKEGSLWSKEYRWEGWYVCNRPDMPRFSCSRDPTIILVDNPAYWKLLFCSEYDGVEDGCFEIFKVDKRDDND